MLDEDKTCWSELRTHFERSLFVTLTTWNRLKVPHDVLKAALTNPAERNTALRLLLTLNDDQLKMQLFPTLVDLAGVGHSDIGLVRTVIKSLPRHWVHDHIAQHARPSLAAGDDEEYRRFAELFLEIGDDLLAQHVAECLSHPNPDIKEVGQNFHEFLSRNP